MVLRDDLSDHRPESGEHLDAIAHGEDLECGIDPVDAPPPVVVDPVVAVPASSSVADLEEPREDVSGGGVDVIARVVEGASGRSSSSPGIGRRMSSSLAPHRRCQGPMTVMYPVRTTVAAPRPQAIPRAGQARGSVWRAGPSSRARPIKTRPTLRIVCMPIFPRGYPPFELTFFVRTSRSRGRRTRRVRTVRHQDTSFQSYRRPRDGAGHDRARAALGSERCTASNKERVRVPILWRLPEIRCVGAAPVPLVPEERCRVV